MPGSVQTQYWLPLHNSYDPWDSDIASGHAFEQTSWNRVTTNTAYAKTNKVHHQSPTPDGGNGDGTGVIHICGIKFNDLNGNGQYDPETDGVINDVMITLLGTIDPDQKAEVTYQGKLTIQETHGNPVLTGEGGNAAPGVYCFNLIDVQPGTYQFYIRIEEPQGTEATTPTLITLAPITISDSETVYRVDNNFGNVRPPKVALTKTLTQPAGGTALVGNPVIFTIKIKNTGTTTLVTIPLTDTYDPSKLEYDALTPPTPAPDSVTVGKISWIDLTTTLGDLAPNQEFTIVVAFKAVAPTTGPTINFADTTYAIDQYQQQTGADDPADLIIIAQGPYPRAAVGGIVLPANKLEIVAPFAALAGLIVAVSTVAAVKKRRD